MKIDVLLGLQWGDEGKGKIVDVLSPQYDIIARFQGGPNAGHTLIFNKQKYVLHLIPSGIFRDNTINVIGDGVVLDPVIFAEEVEKIELSGRNLKNNLFIGNKTTLILPTHRILDAANENELGKSKIGSTGKGIGPAYTDKIARYALRVGDILSADFKEKYEKLKQRHLNRLKSYDFNFEYEEYEEKWFESIEKLKQFKFINCCRFFNNALNEGKKILAEGAQGTLLDINSGTYPFVTSSTVTTSGVCSGLGIAPNKIGEVYGIFKAYTTRVGSGPFPTELFDDEGKKLQESGQEFGATTGRERRCGWLDMIALKYAIQINGVTQLIMTKVDVLQGFDKFKVSEKYKIKEEIIDYFPYEITDDLEPIFLELPAWEEDLKNIKSKNDFPKELKDYISYIEKETGVQITVVSTGPDREDTVLIMKK
ncbi:MAG: adenylosuccinate synthase [Bacteroidales bacterium]|nr:adenylosuccinate synthase [Bacteroidales bacterium]